MKNENIQEVNWQGKTVCFVKTAHISSRSVEDVREAVASFQPDAIAIELDQDRYDSLQRKEAWKEKDIIQVIKDKKVGFLLANMILASFQRRMAKNLHTSAGGEMKEAVRIAEERGIPLSLIDRPVKLTFARIWSSLGLWEKAKLLSSILFSLFDREEISEEDLASLKQQDALETSLQEVGKEFPIVKRILVDERDRYLAAKINETEGQRIVAVIGAAHAAGILRNSEAKIDIAELESVPTKKGKLSYLKWIIPLLIITLVSFTFLQNRHLGWAQIQSWIWWNGALSAGGALLAAGHPLTVLTSFLLAPLTSLNPLLAVGWFAGLVQAAISKPKVKDFESLSQDTESWKGFWKNKVTRILLVVLFSNLFSTIGTFISGSQIVLGFLRLFQ